MKNLNVIMLTLVMCFVTFMSFGQINMKPKTEKVIIGEVGKMPGMPPTAALEYVKGDDENLYTLSYRNAKYSKIIDYNSITFKGDNELINSFYITLLDLINGKVNEELEFNIGDEYLLVKCISNMGVKSLQIHTTDNGTTGFFWLTKKQLDKLFGI